MKSRKGKCFPPGLAEGWMGIPRECAAGQVNAPRWHQLRADVLLYQPAQAFSEVDWF